ncbi:MAG: hypothetical protein U1A78_08325 [Polyangia bacterium]
MALSGVSWLCGPGPAAAAPDVPELAALGRYGRVESVRTAAVHAGHGERLQLLRGPLTAPQPGLPPHEAAARALAELRRAVPSLIPRELGVPEVQAVGTAHLLRYGQHHHGVPILDGELVLQLDERGAAVRLRRDVLEADELARIDPRPTLSPLEAQRAVQRLGRGDTAAALLVIDRETARLCYAVGTVDPRRFESALYLIDAHSGELLRRIERLALAAAPRAASGAAPQGSQGLGR